MADDKPPKYVCTECGKQVTATKNGRYRTHTDGTGENCSNSSVEIPPRELEAGALKPGADPGVPEEGRDYARCPDCERNVPLTRLGYYENHNETLRGSVRCGKGGTRYRREEVLELPPVPVETKVDGASSSPSPTAEPRYRQPAEWSVPEGMPEREKPVMDSSPSPIVSPDGDGIPGESGTPWVSVAPTTPTSPAYSGRYLQPGPRYMQPPEYVPPVKAEMGDHAKLLSTRIRETFYAYSNRNTEDNRTAQVTMGPSEIGSPCDRQIAMNLMGVEPVNPGGDGWAAFVGTCTHEGMAQIYRWASAGTGRYSVEKRLKYESLEVPGGTSDLFDRAEGDAIDWKVMGKYSLDKFKREGPSTLYRTQIHVYGLGQELSGEKVRNVAIVGLPRASAELTDMHVWSEPYDRSIAENALNRVRKIHAQVRGLQQTIETPADWDGNAHSLRLAAEFDTDADGGCKYCPFYRKNDTEMEAGCPGPATTR